MTKLVVLVPLGRIMEIQKISVSQMGAFLLSLVSFWRERFNISTTRSVNDVGMESDLR